MHSHQTFNSQCPTTANTPHGVAVVSYGQPNLQNRDVAQQAAGPGTAPALAQLPSSQIHWTWLSPRVATRTPIALSHPHAPVISIPEKRKYEEPTKNATDSDTTKKRKVDEPNLVVGMECFQVQIKKERETWEQEKRRFVAIFNEEKAKWKAKKARQRKAIATQRVLLDQEKEQLRRKEEEVHRAMSSVEQTRASLPNLEVENKKIEEEQTTQTLAVRSAELKARRKRHKRSIKSLQADREKVNRDREVQSQLAAEERGKIEKDRGFISLQISKLEREHEVLSVAWEKLARVKEGVEAERAAVMKEKKEWDEGKDERQAQLRAVDEGEVLFRDLNLVTRRCIAEMHKLLAVRDLCKVELKHMHAHKADLHEQITAALEATGPRLVSY